jgi:transmembrane sensor
MPSHDDSPDLDLALLARFFSGDCTPEERETVASWIAADPARATEVEELRAAWDAGSEVDPSEWNVHAALRGVHERRRTRAGRGAPSAAVLAILPPRERRRVTWPWATLAAAVVVAAVGVTAAIVRQQPTRSDAAGRLYATRRGERETVTLSDGTQLTLAPATQIRLGSAFGAGRRDVSLLEGEALFVVTHDARHPFAVHARNAVATDVGTVFAVRSYREDAGVRVVVGAGVVALGGAQLGAGTAGTVDATGQIRVTTHADTERELAWTRGALVFAKTPVREVLTDLGRWYDLDIRLADTTLARRTVTGSFQNAPTLDVLGAIAATLGTTYSRDGRVVLFGAQP